MEETVVIKRSEYERLLKNSEVLDALESMGVDNWEGYGDAMRSLRKNDEC